MRKEPFHPAIENEPFTDIQDDTDHQMPENEFVSAKDFSKRTQPKERAKMADTLRAARTKQKIYRARK